MEHLQWLLLFLHHIESLSIKNLFIYGKYRDYIFRYWLRNLKLINKIFIIMKVSLGVLLLDLCLVTIETQLSKIPQFIFITNEFGK